jgi:hypothetical protein
MYEAFQKEIARLVVWVKEAQLLEERQLLWCLHGLPAAYRELARTYESRFADAIVSRQQTALAVLAGQTGPVAALLTENLHGKFQSLNQRFGLQALPPQRLARLPNSKRTGKNKKPPASA